MLLRVGQLASFVANKSSTSITTTSSSSCCSSRSILCLSMLIRRSCCNTRALSTQSMQSAAATSSSSSSFQKQPAGPPTFLVETNNGRTYRLLDSTKAPKVKPGIINQRLSKMRTYVGTQKNIRHSPWRLNLICQMIAGLPVPEALRQLQFCDKSFAPTVQQVVQKTVNRADIRDGLQPTQLEVAQCFATRGTPLKRIKPMARGRHGKMTRPHAHMRLILREIDFSVKIYQQRSKYAKLKWLNLMHEAEEDAAEAQAKRAELQAVKARQEEIRQKEREAAKK